LTICGRIESSITFTVSQSILGAIVQHLSQIQGQYVILMCIIIMYIVDKTFVLKGELEKLVMTFKRFGVVMLTQNSLNILSSVYNRIFVDTLVSVTIACVYVVVLSVFFKISLYNRGKSEDLNIDTMVNSVQYVIAQFLVSVLRDMYVKKIVALLVVCTVFYWIKYAETDTNNPFYILTGAFAMSMVNLMLSFITGSIATESVYIAVVITAVFTILASRLVKMIRENERSSLQTVEAYIELILYGKIKVGQKMSIKFLNILKLRLTN
jgi:hypothetical protein